MKMTDSEELWTHIANNPRVNKTRFNPYFLTQTGEILSKRGFHEARMFLWDSCRDRRLREQAEAILYVINLMESASEIRLDRSKGRFIIKQISNIR